MQTDWGFEMTAWIRAILGGAVTFPTLAVLFKFAWGGEVWAISILVSMTVAVLTFFGFDVKIDTSIIKLAKRQ